MEIARQMRVEKVDTATPCVRLEPVQNVTPRAPAGTGIKAMIVETIEATPDTSFWGTVTSCAGFEVVVRRRN